MPLLSLQRACPGGLWTQPSAGKGPIMHSKQNTLLLASG